MQEITVRIGDGERSTVQSGLRVWQLLKDAGVEMGPCVASRVNNELVSLSYKVDVNAAIQPVSIDSEDGSRILRRSLCFLLSMTSFKLFPKRRLVISHSLGDAYFYYYDGMQDVPEEDIRRLDEGMRSIDDLPITRKLLAYEDAVALFDQTNQTYTSLLLKFKNDPKIPIYSCGEYNEMSYEPLVPSTGFLKTFEILPYGPGFLLRYPEANDPYRMKEFKDNPVLFSVYQEYKAWGKILNVQSAGRLNELASSREIAQFINVAEALHNKKIAEIADRIFERKDSVRVVLIAGPSSSGKTTFAKKLSIQLQVLGFNPVPISLDDYFVQRELTPKDENGQYDFESIEAIDVAELNRNLVDLFSGKETELPSFDFKTGLRKTGGGKRLKLERRNIIILEGIHGLNDRLTPLVPAERKYKIYISALTQLNLDDTNRISTTDNRLLRRLVRDYQFRGHSAHRTFEMWPSVRRGENKNIFPFQNNADSAFNSALDYELAVLKIFAEPLLKMVKPHDFCYNEAMRLQSFLQNFVPISPSYVPNQSILREFIGDSAFKY
jgi:uridine kinase